MKFVVILEPHERWIWELRTAEGEPLCRSVSSYGSRDQVFKAIQSVRMIAPRALVFDLVGTLFEGV